MFDADAAQALDSAVNLFQEISRLNMAARYSKVIYIINDDLCYTWMPIFFFLIFQFLYCKELTYISILLTKHFCFWKKY